MSTHEVSNQTPPMSGHNLYQTDVVLAEAVARAGGGWAETELSQFGLLVGSEELAEHGRLANENRPTLRAYDRFGYRVNEVVYHPS